jgi:endoglucanase
LRPSIPPLTACLAIAVGVLLASSLGPARGAPPDGEWVKYREHFITGDGRALDTGNHAVSHSEGQGWAMLFAQSFDDRTAFDRIWGWTRERLQRSDNALFCWRWDPLADTPIADRNNASDGDILIAWALSRAGDRWKEPEYRREAQRIIRDIRGKLVEPVAGRLVLLPGADGFKSADGTVTVNPSYYIFPTFKDFARIDPSPVWSRLGRDGLDLLARARFGRWGLTPDWVAINSDGAVAPRAGQPARFGFDAIRIPLYLIWGGAATPDRLAAELRFWAAFPGRPIPAWIDVADDSVAPYPGPPGFQAIIALTRGFAAQTPPPLPPLVDGDDYYSSSLILLAGLARRAVAGR